MGEVRGRRAVGLLGPLLSFSGRALFPMPKQIFRLYAHVKKYLTKTDAFLPKFSGTPAVFDSKRRIYESERGALSPSDIVLVCGRARLSKGGEAVFLALSSIDAPEDWANALVFRAEEKALRLYEGLKLFKASNSRRFNPEGSKPRRLSEREARAEFRRFFPAVVFDLEMNYERPIQFAGRRLFLTPDGEVAQESLSLYVRQRQKLSRYVAALTRLTEAFLAGNGILEDEAAQKIHEFLSGGVCFVGSALHNDMVSLRGMFRRTGFSAEVLKRDVVDLAAAVRFDRGETNEPSLKLCMEHGGEFYGVTYRLISADYLNCSLLKIR